MSNIDNLIANLKPGQSKKISGDYKVWCTVERTGNGKMVRFVRHTPNSSEVFKTAKF